MNEGYGSRQFATRLTSALGRSEYFRGSSLRGAMLKVLLRVVADAAIIAIVLFGAAGTLAWPRAWILLDVMLVVRITSAVTVYRVNPDLLRERATVLIHRGQPRTDRVVLFAFMTTAFIGVPAVAALDVFRWHALPGAPRWLAAIGLALFALGWFITALALRENAFAVTVIRLQAEREHRVVDTGVYSIVRHPMYAGNPLVLLGLSLWLGSFTAALFALVPLALLMLRIVMEERFLRRELPGYREYAARVRDRLLPRIW
jgi:protein-S-isoprenylcysteine O-methyltransferase Ste14